MPFYFFVRSTIEVEMSTRQFIPHISRPSAIRRRSRVINTEQSTILSRGSTPLNRCTPFFRALAFRAMTEKGRYYFSLPWQRETFETLDDLATLPVRYYVYTTEYVYRKRGKAVGTERETSRALLMRFPATFTFPSRCTNACVRACMRSTPVHAHRGQVLSAEQL